MASERDKNQDKNLNRTERQVQQDVAYLNAQLAAQQSGGGQPNDVRNTADLAAATSTAAVHNGFAVAGQLLLGAVNTMAINPAKALASTYNPFVNYSYAPYHPGFIANIGGGIGGEGQAVSNVQQSLAMAAPRTFQSLGWLAGLGITESTGALRGTLAHFAVGNALGIGGKLGGLLSGALGWGLFGVGFDIADRLTEASVDIGAYQQMANRLGWKYRTTLSSKSLSGVGFSPNENYEFGTTAYKFTKGSGYGLTGYYGEHFNNAEVESAINAADQSGLFRDATTVKGMLDKVSTLLRSYKSVAKELHITAQAGMGLTTSLMTMGYNSPENIVGIIRSVKSTAQFTGQSFQEALYGGFQSAQRFMEAGLGAQEGMNYGLRGNEYLSYNYQTHASQRMPEALGGYNAAYNIQNTLQQSLLGNPQFRNAVILASIGGGYNKGMMDVAIEGNPNVMAYYSKAALGHTPTAIYANLWKSQGAMSQAASDPSMVARYYRGLLLRARIDLHNADAVKGYLYRQLTAQGLPAGQARYTADNLYANVQNVNVMDNIENSNYAYNQNPYEHHGLMRALWGERNVEDWNAMWRYGLHVPITRIGMGVNSIGTTLANRFGEFAERNRHYILAPNTSEPYEMPNRMINYLNSQRREDYISPYNSDMLGMLSGYLKYQAHPATMTKAEEDLLRGEAMLAHQRPIEYNWEYEAKSEEIHARKQLAFPSLGEAVVGLIASPSPVGIGMLLHGTVNFIRDVSLHEMGHVLGENAVDRINQEVASMNGGKMPRMGSPDYEKSLSAILKQEGISQDTWLRTLKYYRPKVTGQYQDQIASIKEYRSKELHAGHGFLGNIKQSIKGAGGISDKDLLTYIGLMEKATKTKAGSPEYKMYVERLGELTKGHEAVYGRIKDLLNGSYNQAYLARYGDNADAARYATVELKNLASSYIYSGLEAEATEKKLNKMLGVAAGTAGTPTGKLYEMITSNGKITKSEMKEIDKMSLPANIEEAWEVYKSESKKLGSRSQAYENFKAYVENMNTGNEVVAGTHIDKELIDSMGVLVTRMTTLTHNIERLIPKTGGY